MGKQPNFNISGSVGNIATGDHATFGDTYVGRVHGKSASAATATELEKELQSLRDKLAETQKSVEALQDAVQKKQDLPKLLGGFSDTVKEVITTVASEKLKALLPF